MCWAVVVHAFNPGTWEAEAGGTLWVQCQPGLQELVPGQAPKQDRETLSQKTKTNTNKQTNKQKEKKIGNLTESNLQIQFNAYQKSSKILHRPVEKNSQLHMEKQKPQESHNIPVH